MRPLITTVAFNDACARVIVQLESMEVEASPVPRSPMVGPNCPCMVYGPVGPMLDNMPCIYIYIYIWGAWYRYINCNWDIDNGIMIVISIGKILMTHWISRETVEIQEVNLVDFS